MSFKDLADFFEIAPKRLPIGGKVYEFPGSISAKAGLLLHRMSEAAEQAKRKMDAGEDPGEPDPALADGFEDVDIRAEVMGDADEQLIADGVPGAYIEHVLATLIAWHQYGEAVAKAVWEDAPGKAQPQDRQPRKAGSASATTTKKRASTRSTAKSKPARSGGRGSSSTGGSSSRT